MVLITHGRLSEQLLHNVEHICGPLVQAAAICIGPDDDMERRRRDIIEISAQCDSGAGVVLFVDMLGGTPANLAISVMEQTHAEVIAGMNVPMLLDFIETRDNILLPEAVAQAQQRGRLGVRVATPLLAEAIGRLASIETGLREILPFVEELRSPGLRRGSMGHNRPPVRLRDASADNAFAVIRAAIEHTGALQHELLSNASRADEIQEIVGTLRILYSRLEPILRWLGKKLDRLVDGMIDSTSKNFGKIVIVAALIREMHQAPVLLAQIIQILETLKS